MPVSSTIWRRLAALAAVGGMLGLAPVAGAAQQATPVAPAMSLPIDVPLIDASGEAVGLATFSEGSDGVTTTVLIEGLTPGEHGWHLHEMGVCAPVGGAEPFAGAGGHWNPTMMMHGGPEDEDRHAGDFGNLTANDAGLAEFEVTSDAFTLGAGQNSLFDEDGTAFIVHERMDDLVTQPGGDSGARYACGVVAEPTMAPVAAPAGIATPVS